MPDMDQRGSFAARWIGQARKALAAGAAALLRDRHERLVVSAGELGFLDVVADTETRLEFLCEALAAGRSGLFADHLHWLKVSYTNRGLESGYVRAQAEAIRDELRESMPEPYSGLAGTLIDDALRGFDTLDVDSDSLLVDDTPHVDLTRRYLEAALAGQRHQAERLIDQGLKDGISPQELESWVVMRAQQEIGRMWQVGDLHTAEEHFASRLAERVLNRLFLAKTPSPRRGLRVIVASVGGNDHDLAARMLADRFELAGWDSILLGANMPPLDVARSLMDHDAHLVALSTAMALHVRAAHEVVHMIRQTPRGSEVPVLVGGHPFAVVDDLWKVIGADGTAADFDRAVALADELVSQTGAAH